jgi:tetratricopeptide (TPR) repeat protein
LAKRGISTRPSSISGQLSYALYLLKDIPGSINELKLTLELKPDSAFALNHLAWIYATAADRKLRNPAEAVVLARRAVQSSREPNAAFIDTLAEALLVNGQAAEALATEQRAAELDPQNAEVQSRLARFREAAHKVVSTKP